MDVILLIHTNRLIVETWKLQEVKILPTILEFQPTILEFQPTILEFRPKILEFQPFGVQGLEDKRGNPSLGDQRKVLEVYKVFAPVFEPFG
jgi:hypothetical protein